MNLEQVRADIKHWERDFASIHGRDPAVQDIKDNPDIAGKYKLYKKLSKTLPKSRPADPAPPLPRSNPFSPVKRSLSRPLPHPNPFATPTKNNPGSHSRALSPSPDPPHPNPDASSSHPLPPAVFRARKRLRGEPVSPSPNKPKRQRIRSRAKPDYLSSSSEYEADRELPQCDFTSFVADSPAKAPAGSKSFKLLFDDTLPIPKKPLGTLVQLDSPPDATSPRDLDPSLSTSLKPRRDPTIVSGPGHRVNRALSKVFPAKDSLPAPSHKLAFPAPVSGAPQPRSSVKRALDSANIAHENPDPRTSLQSQHPLIPPSPPPHDSAHRDTGKGKAKSSASRKKLRVDNQESDDASTDDFTFRVTTITHDPDKRLHRHEDDLDWDPLPHLETHNHDPEPKRHIDANRHASGTFTVDLPDKLRRVLAISPSRNQDSTEERVVRGLLCGDRVGHYDPFRGGDIWDAGETDDAAYGDVETEDDWEGEPIPWEIGEL